MAATITGNGGYGLISTATAQNSTSGTALDFSSIPSGVRRVTVMFSGVSTNGTSIPLIQIGAGSVTTSGYVSAAIGTSAGGLGTTSFTTGFGLRDAFDATRELSGSAVLTNISGNTWVASYFGNAGSSGSANCFGGGGRVTLGGTLDRVRITTVNGTDTFDAGTINIFYE